MNWELSGRSEFCGPETSGKFRIPVAFCFCINNYKRKSIDIVIYRQKFDLKKERQTIQKQNIDDRCAMKYEYDRITLTLLNKRERFL